MNQSNNNINGKLDIKIVVAAHKKYRMPEDDIYLPLHVGAEGKEPIGCQGDNTGDNISNLNPYFCELTGLYWMWKNVKADYMGLVHYRRHFCLQPKKGTNRKENNWASILNTEEAQLLCEQYDVIVPTKRHYWMESLESHYTHTHEEKHLRETRKIIAEKYPQYLNSCSSVFKQKSGYMFNMFLMRADLADAYCSFLFDVLLDLNRSIDMEGYSPFEARFPGRIGEILFNVWLDRKRQEQKLKVKEIGYIHMEPINWWAKGTAFLGAKFLGKKYEHGF